MGLFSGEDVYAFDIATAKLVNKDVDPFKDAILTAILVEEDIPSYILATMLNSISLKAKKYLQYGKDKYIYGLPTSSIAVGVTDPEAVATAIEDSVGVPVTLITAFIDSPDEDYFAYEWLEKTFGFIPSDKEITISPLGGFVIERIYNDSALEFQKPPENILIDVVETNAADPDTAIKLTLDMPYPEGAVYYHATYYLDSETKDDFRFWTYDPTTGVYPDLSDYTFGDISSSYYPIAPIRVDRKWVEDDPLEDDDTVDPWITTKRLLRRVTLNIPDIREAVEKDQDADDIDNLHDIFFLFAVDVYTEVEETHEYLYKFFEKILPISSSNKAFYTAWYNDYTLDEWDRKQYTTRPPTNVYSVKEEQFKSHIRYSYMEETTETGQLEREYEKEIIYERAEEVRYSYTFYDLVGEPQTITTKFYIEKSQILVKKDNGDGTYNQIMMYGPEHISRVKAFDKEGYVYRSIDKDYIPDPDDPNWDKDGQSGFFFPVDFEIMDTLSFRDQMYALMDAMLLTIYAADKQHLEWYETGVFRALLQFVMIVVNVVLFIPTLGSSLKLSAVLWKLFLAFAVPRLVNYIFELLVKHLGKDVAIFLIAAFFAFSLFRGLGNSLKGLPNALDILGVTKAITRGIGAATQIQGINQQAELDEMQKSEEELRDAQDLMDQDGYQPWYAIQAMIYTEPEEDPEDFYHRTIHLGNPGVLSLEMVNTFHDRALLLPDPGEVGRSIIV